LLMGGAFLLFLAIVSFRIDDPVSMDIGDEPIPVNNWMGPLGAVISNAIMQWTFGYAALLFPLLLFMSGFTLYRKENISTLIVPSLKLLAWAVFGGIVLALPEALATDGLLKEYYPSGLISGWLAAKLVLYLGDIGTLLVSALLLVVLLVVTVRFDMLETVAIAGRAVREFYTGLKQRLGDWLAERAVRREEKAQRKAMIKRDKKKKAETEIVEQPAEPLMQEAEEEFADEGPAEEMTLDEAQISTSDEAFVSDEEEEDLPSQDEDDLFEEDAETHEKTSGGQAEMDFELREEVKEKQLDYDDLVKESISRFEFPSIDLLNSPPKDRPRISKDELKANAALLEAKLGDYGVKARVVRVTAGPVITLYELEPAPGVKVSSIVSLENDLALAMEARGIRIIAPIPGKAAVGIEIPNRNPQMVYLKSLIRSEKFSQGEFELPLAVGKAINGESFIVDLVKMPHLLIAGATGAGKSVGINTIICSLLYSVDPGQVKFVMVDPKKLELSLYRDLREHYLLYRPDLDEDVITKPNNAVSMLNTMVLEMERRQERMHQMGVRNIREYNRKVAKNPRLYRGTEHQQMPYIVVVIDELADLMMVAAKEVETPIARLAQMARAGGIHMIVATQRPSVDVITGLIKANLPARLAYQVATKVDSRTILDINGAEQLLGNGDLLFKITGTAKPIRLQNPFVATEEVEAVIRHISKQPKLPYYSLPQPSSTRGDSLGFGDDGDDRDPLYEDARAIVVQSQQGSISLLQRRLKIGYSRAARLIDEMEDEGVVGAAMGGKPREVLMTLQELNNIS